MRAPPLPLLLVLATACAPAPSVDTAPVAPSPRPPSAESADPGTDDIGVLVMAHGGTPEWNASIEGAVAPLRSRVPTAVAYGMANPRTLAAALDSLEQAGVERVAVVRMFLSGESFLDQTRYYLGLAETPPETFVLMGPAAADPKSKAQVAHDLTVATHEDGMLGSPEAASIMAERARVLSTDPDDESVLLLAHGMGEEDENDRVLDVMTEIAAGIHAAGFPRVRTATLREDWEGPRERAEAEIRAYVETESAAGRRVIVLPARLSGFGPYAEVLDGLTYIPGDGLLPHDEIGHWVLRTAEAVSCSAGWGPLQGRGECAAVVVSPATLQPAPEGR